MVNCRFDNSLLIYESKYKLITVQSDNLGIISILYKPPPPLSYRKISFYL